MSRSAGKFAAISVFALITLLAAYQGNAQSSSILGSWKITVAGAPPNTAGIFLISFEAGGIVHIGQANGHRSVAFGHWNNAGGGNYRFQDTHLLYSETTPFEVIATEEHFVTLSIQPGGATFTGNGRLVTTDLDGNVISDFELPIVGERLPDPDF